MKKILCIWKPVGLTPLESIERFKSSNKEYLNQKISYAGRLDPMAEGILVLLIGEENKRRTKYLKLKKEYVSEIILGISTDTFDSLGLIEKPNLKNISENEIKKSLNTFIGKQEQIYPPYSSKSVKGKPLYWWARNNKIKNICIPSHDIEIYSIELIDIEKDSVDKLTQIIISNINKVSGDFRQQEIIKKWKDFGEKNTGKELIKVKVKFSCSSGTYIRGIAKDLGKKVDSEAFALSIKRTRVGSFSKKDCINL